MNLNEVFIHEEYEESPFIANHGKEIIDWLRPDLKSVPLAKNPELEVKYVGSKYCDIVITLKNTYKIAIENKLGECDFDHHAKIVSEVDCLSCEFGVLITEGFGDEHIIPIEKRNDCYDRGKIFLVTAKVINNGHDIKLNCERFEPLILSLKGTKFFNFKFAKETCTKEEWDKCGRPTSIELTNKMLPYIGKPIKDKDKRNVRAISVDCNEKIGIIFECGGGYLSIPANFKNYSKLILVTLNESLSKDFVGKNTDIIILKTGSANKIISQLEEELKKRNIDIMKVSFCIMNQPYNTGIKGDVTPLGLLIYYGMLKLFSKSQIVSLMPIGKLQISDRDPNGQYSEEIDFVKSQTNIVDIITREEQESLEADVGGEIAIFVRDFSNKKVNWDDEVIFVRMGINFRHYYDTYIKNWTGQRLVDVLKKESDIINRDNIIAITRIHGHLGKKDFTEILCKKPNDAFKFKTKHDKPNEKDYLECTPQNQMSQFNVFHSLVYQFLCFITRNGITVPREKLPFVWADNEDDLCIKLGINNSDKDEIHNLMKIIQGNLK